MKRKTTICAVCGLSLKDHNVRNAKGYVRRGTPESAAHPFRDLGRFTNQGGDP